MGAWDLIERRLSKSRLLVVLVAAASLALVLALGPSYGGDPVVEVGPETRVTQVGEAAAP